MHPSLSVSRLSGLDESIVKTLSVIGPCSQTAMMPRLHGVPPSTLSRAGRRLVEQGIVEKTGTTRDAVFSLTPPAAHFARPPHLRGEVAYDMSRINSYVPNKTRWLPKEAEEKMVRASRFVGHGLDPQTYSRKIRERFLVDLSWASSRLEGNTYGKEETERLIRFSVKSGERDFTESTMVLNHSHAILFLLKSIEGSGVTPDWMHRTNSLLMRDLVEDTDLGRVRSGRDIGIGASSYRPSKDETRLSADLRTLCRIAQETHNPFESSFLLLAGISYLQTYADGNKRTGRLACNLPLLRVGLPPISFLDVDRNEYSRAIIVFYEAGDPQPLACVVAQAYAMSAHLYAVAETQRVPPSAAFHHRRRIDQVVSAIMHASLESAPLDVDCRMRAELSDLPEEDQTILRGSITSILSAIGPHNHDAWGISSELTSAYLAVRDGTKAPGPWKPNKEPNSLPHMEKD